MMKKWKKPVQIQCDSKHLSNVIKASAWSVGDAYQLGEFLDEANLGSRGSVYMDFNYGHAIQVEVIGWTILGGYRIITLLTSSGETYSYSRPESGGMWERY